MMVFEGVCPNDSKIYLEEYLRTAKKLFKMEDEQGVRLTHPYNTTNWESGG